MPNIYDEFLRWLKNTDTDRFFAAKMGRNIMYIKIKCNDKNDMIYCLCYTDGEEMVAKENLEYQAVYCKPEEKLYDVQYNLYDMLRKYGSIELGYETERCEFEERVRERIEEIVAGYSDRIVLDNDAREKLERYKYSIDQAARKLYFYEADADVLYK